MITVSKSEVQGKDGLQLSPSQFPFEYYQDLPNPGIMTPVEESIEAGSGILSLATRVAII